MPKDRRHSHRRVDHRRSGGATALARELARQISDQILADGVLARAKAAGWKPPKPAPEFNKKESAIAVLIYYSNGWPKSEPAWAPWYREFQLRPGDPRGTRDRKAVKRLAHAMRETESLANTDVLKTLDRAALARYGLNEPPVL